MEGQLCQPRLAQDEIPGLRSNDVILEVSHYKPDYSSALVSVTSLVLGSILACVRRDSRDEPVPAEGPVVPKTRTETDSLGCRELPAGALYGVASLRGSENFDISSQKLGDEPALVRALVRIKRAAAAANRELGALDIRVADAIIAALYDVISGPAGPRGWNRFKSLLLPECRLTPVSHPADAQAVYRTLDAETYIQRAEPAFAKQGFFETGVANRVEEFGSIAHVFSTYESRREQDGAPFARGINSFQLVKLGDRWWVASIMWDTERPDVPIPGKYLGR